MARAPKSEGFVATPPLVARELVSWAAQQPSDKVLDIGAGEGIFLQEVANRLLGLGADKGLIGSQVFGVERDEGRYEAAAAAVRGSFESAAPQLKHADLFDTTFPPLDAFVGNPPYVRRNSLDEIDRVRSRLALLNPFALAGQGRLSDLYSYFVMYATEFLKEGGRAAVIVSSSWMDTDYGIGFKEFLLRTFALRMVVLCETRLFASALIKTVMLFMEKGKETAGGVRFLRMPDFHPGFSSWPPERQAEIGSLYTIDQKQLDPKQPWSIYLRRADAYFALASTQSRPLGDFGESRIGIQPLARDFYILTKQRAAAEGVPEECLRPLVDSPRSTSSLLIDNPDGLPHRILYVREPLEKISSASLRGYISAAQDREVRIRGKEDAVTVTGYHNVPRLMACKRQPWYNLADEIDRRGRWPILVPRRFYQHFQVLWNPKGAVANENFLEFKPENPALIQPLLAVLNSSFFELACRSRAQQYGGGIYNLNPLDLRRVPIFDLTTLAPAQLGELTEAHRRYIAQVDRSQLDAAVAKAFGLAEHEAARIEDGLADLRRLSAVAKRVAPATQSL